MKRLWRLVLLCALCARLAGAVGAEEFILAIRDGRVCYCAASSGQWVDTGVSSDASLGARERLMLQAGLHLHGRAALSRALEDFCS